MYWSQSTGNLFIAAQNDYRAITRYKRRVLVYRALLGKAGFEVNTNLQVETKGLFNPELIRALQESAAIEIPETGERKILNADYQAAAEILLKEKPKLAELSVEREKPSTSRN